MNEFPNLFKQQTPSTLAVESVLSDQPIPVVQSTFPIEPEKPSTIDEALARKLGRDALLNVKAMDYVMKFVIGRPIKIDDLGKIYDIFYNKIKNGTKQPKTLQGRLHQ